jgi:predicted Zn-dependent protease
MFLSKIIFLISVMVTGAMPATSTFYFNYAGVRMDFPMGWQVDYTDEEPDILFANSPGEEIILMVTIQPIENLDSIYFNLQYDFLQDYKNFKPIKKEQKKINGLTAMMGRAKLTFDDGNYDILTFAILRIPGNRIMVITTINDEESTSANSFELNRIINSIKPI